MELARLVTQRLAVPTIGIGAGPECDGQILVFHDLVGYSNGYLPKFVKRFVELNELLPPAIKAYVTQVKAGSFPADEQSYHLKKDIDLEEVLLNKKT